MKTKVLIIFAILIILCTVGVKADEVSDYMKKNGIPEETEINIIYHKHYRTYTLIIRYGDTLYAKNLKRSPRKKIAINKPQPKFFKHPNVSIPKRRVGESLDMTGGYK